MWDMWTTPTAYAEERLNHVNATIAHLRDVVAAHPDDVDAEEALIEAEIERNELEDALIVLRYE